MLFRKYYFSNNLIKNNNKLRNLVPTSWGIIILRIKTKSGFIFYIILFYVLYFIDLITRLLVLLIAFWAVNRLTFDWFEWNLSLFPAVITLCWEHFSWTTKISSTTISIWHINFQLWPKFRKNKKTFWCIFYSKSRLEGRTCS